MNRPIVVTRPVAQANALASKIAAAGGRAIIFPLLHIEPIADDTALRAEADALSSYAMVAFVSPNAIDAFIPKIHPWPSEVVVAVMGEGSRARLSEYGLTSENVSIVSPHDPLRSDSQTLVESLDLQALRGKRVLIVRGDAGRELLADTLRDAGVNVTQVTGYRRSAPVPSTQVVRTLAGLIDSDNDWIITSSEALRNLLALMRASGLEKDVSKIQRQRLAVPHARIKETAESLGFERILLTGSGDDSLITALQSPP